MDFLFSVSGKFRFCNTMAQSPLRHCQSYELEFYYSGTGTSIVDDVRYPHAAGNVLFARPGQSRYTQRPMECYGIHFDCKDEAFAKAYLQDLPTVCLASDTEPLFAQLASTDRNDALRITALLLQILARLRDRPLPRVQRYASEIQKAIAYLEENYAEPICVDTLCGLTYLSHTRFFQAFREITQTTPAAYLAKLRLERAKELLLRTDLTVGEIAARCGFGSQAYFHSFFQRSEGKTPVSYRKDCKKRLI